MSLAAVAGVAAALIVAINLAAIALSGARLSRRTAAISAAPPVTIVRPIKGLEPFSRETLASGLSMDWLDVRTIFCVADAGDPAVPLAHELIALAGEGRARLIVGDVPVSANPKLNNCVRGWDAAETEWVILADSNVLIPRDYAARLFSAWRPDSGLVCSTPVGSRPEGFAAEVECAFLNTYQARWQYAGEAAGFGFAQGKSMLWRKPWLDARGGLVALGAEIAEDAAATKLVNRAGRRVHLVDRPFEQPLGRRTFAEIVQRQFRWARLRRVTFLGVFLPEIASAPALPAALAAFAAPGLGLDWWAGPALVLAPWYAAEIALARSAGWFLNVRTPLAFLVRDAAVPFIWAWAFVGRETTWRGNAMSIATDGRDRLNGARPAAAPMRARRARGA